ncbi:unnamed protein product, partial [marine sediment metagenome]
MDELQNLVSEIDIEKPTDHDTFLKTWVGSIVPLEDDVFYTSFNYQSEYPLKSEDEDTTWIKFDKSCIIGFMNPQTLMCFLPRDKGGNIVANKLNEILFPKSTNILTAPFSEKFIPEFLSRYQCRLIRAGLVGGPTLSWTGMAGYGDVRDTPEYRQAMDMGATHTYVLLHLHDEHMTIGLSKGKGSIIFYHKRSVEEEIDYIKEHIY